MAHDEGLFPGVKLPPVPRFSKTAFRESLKRPTWKYEIAVLRKRKAQQAKRRPAATA